jgi:hypothetical protein
VVLPCTSVHRTDPTIQQFHIVGPVYRDDLNHVIAEEQKIDEYHQTSRECWSQTFGIFEAISIEATESVGATINIDSIPRETICLDRSQNVN